MGGNAIKNHVTRRYDAVEYLAIAEEVQEMLRPYFSRTEPIMAYKNKKDFGDLDLLIQSDGVNFNIVKMIKILFDSKEIVPNGKVYSFEYKEFQVDLILTSQHEFEFARHYYAYNDLGNLMGRIAHKFGLKYGHDGLYYMFRDGTHLIGEICVTMDVREVFRVFDFNYARWEEGFDDLEDIFDFVSRSKYFNPDIYLFDQMNHRSRVRDQKRSTYNAFLKYCDEMRRGEWEDQVFYKFSKAKSDHLPFLFNQFYGFKEQWFKTYHSMLERRDVQTKFNGDRISVMTGLQGKELGSFIQEIKSSFWSPDDFRVWVVTSSFETIEKYVMELMRKGPWVPYNPYRNIE